MKSLVEASDNEEIDSKKKDSFLAANGLHSKTQDLANLVPCEPE